MNRQPEVVAAYVVGAVIAGVVSGLMPLAVGRKYGRTAEGFAGFALCVVSSFCGGLIFAGPLAVIITLAIVVLGPTGGEVRTGFDQESHERRVEELRGLARARQERLEVPLPMTPPADADVRQAIQASNRSDDTYSTPS